MTRLLQINSRRFRVEPATHITDLYDGAHRCKLEEEGHVDRRTTGAPAVLPGIGDSLSCCCDEIPCPVSTRRPAGVELLAQPVPNLACRHLGAEYPQLTAW